MKRDLARENDPFAERTKNCQNTRTPIESSFEWHKDDEGDITDGDADDGDIDDQLRLILLKIRMNF